MLVALTSSGARATAWDAERSTAHTCPACHEAVVLKRGKKRVAHFAHRPGSTCSNAGESPAHVHMKQVVWSAMHASPLVRRCELEWPLGSRRADVWIESDTGLSVAVECQIASYENAEIAQKIDDYTSLGVCSLYLVHACAFPGYIAQFGMGSLHGREVVVPAWVREVALLDPSCEQSLIFFDMTTCEDIPPHEFLHVFDGTDAWLVRLAPIYRDPSPWAPVYTSGYALKRTRMLSVVARLNLALGVSEFYHPELQPRKKHACVTKYFELLGHRMRPEAREDVTPTELVASTIAYRAHTAALAAHKEAAARARRAQESRKRRWIESLREGRGASATPLSKPAVASSSGSGRRPSPTSAPQLPSLTESAQMDFGLAGGPTRAHRAQDE